MIVLVHCSNNIACSWYTAYACNAVKKQTANDRYALFVNKHVWCIHLLSYCQGSAQTLRKQPSKNSEQRWLTLITLSSEGQKKKKKKKSQCIGGTAEPFDTDVCTRAEFSLNGSGMETRPGKSWIWVKRQEKPVLSHCDPLACADCLVFDNSR